MLVKCDYCGKKVEKPTGQVNRARKQGNKLFCNKVCFGLDRRINKTKEQKVKEKAEYDRQYREKNREMLKKKKAEYFQRTYDPEKARIERKKNMQRHIEYCRRPEYKIKKKEYDKQYRAREYGEYSEAYLVLVELSKEVRSQISKYDSMKERNVLNKCLQRSRNGKVKRGYA